MKTSRSSKWALLSSGRGYQQYVLLGGVFWRGSPGGPAGAQVGRVKVGKK